MSEALYVANSNYCTIALLHIIMQLAPGSVNQGINTISSFCITSDICIDFSCIFDVQV